MNFNYLPIKVTVIEAFSLDGQAYQPGDQVEMWWIHVKSLEREGKVERYFCPRSEVMEPIKDVMVFIPVYRLEPETVKAVFALEWDGPITYIFQKDNPGTDGKENHLHQYQRGRETFLAGKYDAMLIIESDIIPPKDALKKLVALEADLGYGVYRFRQGNIVNIFERYPDNNYVQAKNVGESLTVKPWLLARAVQMRRFPCSGGGFGCLLARRKVIEQVPFRMEPGSLVHCDTWFTMDAYGSGFSQFADMSVVCCHIDEDGTKLWPFFPQIGALQ